MELIGENNDSSGAYQLFMESSYLITMTKNGESDFFELARQRLTEISTPPSPPSEWYQYGTNGHQCDIHFSEPHALIDGTSYSIGDDELAPDVDHLA
ncbi:hypothetical protein [Pseudoclavibacter sp. AY1H1]|uniref:hypothetical protein n=1 Tax=Pseudoclavibacter sp. AY1H1 TaxID=2080584 RepID=UPI0011B0A06D|nr:hypothetical protein [Pseudoclavibacter sp. AY1H1]